MSKDGPRPICSRADLALAYELRQSGCRWKLIAYGLGVNEDTLKKSIRRAEERGLS